ncbi:hypothetical protein M2405_006164 [Rhodococcus erythropolis]|nr:hypothetical protein [Rhodococcus erythropolis]MCW2425141.1 hypothetical protein [Rhodococcus erythropolis]
MPTLCTAVDDADIGRGSRYLRCGRARRTMGEPTRRLAVGARCIGSEVFLARVLPVWESRKFPLRSAGPRSGTYWSWLRYVASPHRGANAVD